MFLNTWIARGEVRKLYALSVCGELWALSIIAIGYTISEYIVCSIVWSI